MWKSASFPLLRRPAGPFKRIQTKRVQIRHIHDVDSKWIKIWQNSEHSSMGPDADKPGQQLYYQLPMFPYPSGKLHIGHLRVYTISDALARFRRMNGYKVIHPIGWDAFGLPAENAAIENGVNASDWTYNHISMMRAQINRMLISFDWDREVITCDPEYYKQTQRIFLELYQAGLAYRNKATVNWDPVDKTVLANEQIDQQGRSWRSGAVAEQRELEQWFLKITDLSDELEQDLKLLDDWPEEVKKMQTQWIGNSHGAEVKFGNDLYTFTTKLETLYGVKFIAISNTHPVALEHAADTAVSGLVEGAEAINPLTGEPIPVYVADYVVPGYGTNAVMGVPAHDERDRLFWLDKLGKPDLLEPVYDEASLKMVSGPEAIIGKHIKEARAEILDALVAKSCGKPAKHSRLRDWLVSRQRFWGAPIPMVHCKQDCGVVPVPIEMLPVKLPSDTRNIPLSANKEWLETECPKCGGPAHRDPDTMDTFMDSSWYFFRYLDPRNMQDPFDKAKVAGALPVHCYIGGIEHAILHLLYSRFLAKVLAKIGIWDGSSLNGEPFRKLVTQGMVHGKTYKDKHTGRYLKPHEVSSLPNLKDVTITMEKMSKSKYNGVDPLEVIDKHGADATRAHMLFQAPVQETLDWDSEKIVGVERWLAKVRALAASFSDRASSSHSSSTNDTTYEEWNTACKLQQSITSSFNTAMSLNTVISDYMKLTKIVGSLAKSNHGAACQLFEALLKMMSPVCPASAEEFWEIYLHGQNKQWTSIHRQKWPELQPMEQSNSICEYRVIVDGAPVKPPITAPVDASEASLLAMVDLKQREIKRVVFKPKIKLLSVVTH